MDASSTISKLYPEGELTHAKPSRAPTIAGSQPDPEEFFNRVSEPIAAAKRRKHESYELSGSVFLITTNGQTLKLPTPSDSPADPLSWASWQRAGAFLAVAWHSTVALAVAQAVGILLRVISLDFVREGIEPWELEMLINAPTLFMGIGAFVWVPLTIGMGRRPAFLLAACVTFFATLGAGYAQTFQQLLGCLCFLGLGEGFALTAALLIVIDMTFIHERPKAIAILWSIAGFCGTGFVSIVPYISDHGHQWRPFYRYSSLAALMSLVLVFFLFPETYFKRPTVAFDGLIVLQSATEKLTVVRDIEAGSDDIYRDLPELPNQFGIFGRLKVWRSPFASWTSMGRCYIQIAFCFINPLIFWITIAIAANFVGMLFIGATYPRVLGSAPYNLSSEAVTPLNLSSAFGSLLAYPVGIYPVQKIIDRLTRRNQGVREAEHYLVGLIMPVFAGAVSSLIYGFAAHYGVHIAVYHLAYGLSGFSWVALAISTTMWVTEAFPRWAAPALAVMSGASYLIFSGMTFALVPWITAHGFRFVGIELAVMQVVFGLVAVPIAFWGKSARQAIQGRWADERGGALRPL